MQLSRFSSGPVGWRLYIAAYCAILLSRIAISLFGYRRIANFFRARSDMPPEKLCRRVAAAVQSSARLVPYATCLVQATAARALLALRGYRVTMRVGIRECAATGITAHAWLISGDRVILGSLVDDFDAYRPIADFT
jgi:hypothetical protein